MSDLDIEGRIQAVLAAHRFVYNHDTVRPECACGLWCDIGPGENRVRHNYEEHLAAEIVKVLPHRKVVSMSSPTITEPLDTPAYRIDLVENYDDLYTLRVRGTPPTVAAVSPYRDEWRLIICGRANADVVGVNFPTKELALKFLAAIGRAITR